jgi:minor extracellular serine protease Vpr
MFALFQFRMIVVLLIAQVAAAQGRLDRFALILGEPPLAGKMMTDPGGRRVAAAAERGRLEAAQQNLRAALAEKGISVLGATQVVLNAVYVAAPGAKESELAALPGVVRVERMRPIRRHMNRALDLVNARAAWPVVGGMGNAGAGVKIGILDTGIDQTHPAFQDPSLRAPPGYPRCEPADCAFTSNKVIVARSYVESLVLADLPEFSRPDDLSPRDRVGHGTATAMAAAGVETQGPAATVSGVAPKAFLGNYKIFGSPGVNDVTFGDTILEALEDAVQDGMDIVVLAEGRPAEWGPNDRGAVCNLSGADPCDVRAAAVENAIASGLTVVISAGNDGDLAFRFPALNSIHSPGTAPSAITVGATTNSHVFFSTLQATGDGVLSHLQRIPAIFGDGPRLLQALTAPLRDIAANEPDRLACRPLGTGTLTGAIALIDRGDCAFATKVNNAQRAGAAAVVIVQSGGSNFIFPMTGLRETGIPAVMIGSQDGEAVRSFLPSDGTRLWTLDPKLVEEEVDAHFDTVAYFSSRGPGIGEDHIKPELVAVGTDLYLATQSYDPNGDMWSTDLYTAAQGTSFAAPMVAGAAALVKQLNPAFLPAELKSAVVNTASGDLSDFDETGSRVPASVTAVGAGKLNVAQAVRATVTAEPAALSFGVVSNTSLTSRGLRIRNRGNSPVNLTIRVEPADSRVELSVASLSLSAGASEQITVRVATLPPPGSYEGFVAITGGGAALRVPYLYLRGDAVPFNMLPIGGFDFVANAGELVPGDLLVKVIDRFGVPVPNVPIQFRPVAAIVRASDRTNSLGIAFATAAATVNPGEVAYSAELLQGPVLGVFFPGRVRLRPAIFRNGVVNAASIEVGQGLAPGSYISIFGRSLSEAFRVFDTPYLPLALAGVSVSFDAPERNLSLPGRLHFVSEGQVNVQVPWELHGLNSVQLKVSIGPITESPLYTVPLRNHSPAFFEMADPAGSGRRLLAALDENNQILTSANPARRGRIVQLFANGLGPVDNTPPSGEVTPASPLAQTLDRPEVTIGGQPAAVHFSGLTPFSVGLYQVNVVVSEGLAPGLHEVVLTIGGVRSRAALLHVG